LTLGADGMVLVTKDGVVTHIPSLAREVFDVSGAGDTVTAWTGAMLAAGSSLKEAALLATYAAGIEVSKAGVATVTPEEVLALHDGMHDRLGMLRRWRGDLMRFRLRLMLVALVVVGPLARHRARAGGSDRPHWARANGSTRPPAFGQDTTRCPQCVIPKKIGRASWELVLTQLIPWSFNHFVRDRGVGQYLARRLVDQPAESLAVGQQCVPEQPVLPPLSRQPLLQRRSHQRLQLLGIRALVVRWQLHVGDHGRAVGARAQ
jgi:hypothetical protein